MLECPICYEDYDNKQSKIFLDCGHNMCSSCLFEFFKRDQPCGFCRESFKVADITLLYMLKYSLIKNKTNLFKYALNFVKADGRLLNIRDEDGNTVLHYACMFDKEIDKLISKGANPFIPNKNRVYPFSYLSKSSKYYKLLKYHIINRFYISTNLYIIYLFAILFWATINNLFINLILLILTINYTNKTYYYINKFKFSKDIKKFRKEVLSGVIPDKKIIEKVKKLNLEDHLNFLKKAGYID